LSRYEDAGYSYIPDDDIWVYVIPAPNKGLLGLVDGNSIQVKTIKSVYKESALNDD
tara:strand:+ start:5400 stop:5567 length:168 start_codon:yes stop_codon:yes gene_type:complete